MQEIKGERAVPSRAEQNQRFNPHLATPCGRTSPGKKKHLTQHTASKGEEAGKHNLRLKYLH